MHWAARVRSTLAFIVVLSCAACAIDDDSDRSVGFFDAGASNDSTPPPSRSSAPTTPRCDDGATMTSPHFVGAPLETAGSTALRLSWQSNLPAAYYEDVRVDEGSVVEATSPISAYAMSITMTGAPASHAGKTETFTLLFPDRRGFVECAHIGSGDTYRVKIAVTFSDDATATTATFEESTDLGGI